MSIQETTSKNAASVYCLSHFIGCYIGRYGDRVLYRLSSIVSMVLPLLCVAIGINPTRKQLDIIAS